MVKRNSTEAIRARVQYTKELIEESHRLIEDSKNIKRESDDIIARLLPYVELKRQSSVTR